MGNQCSEMKAQYRAQPEAISKVVVPTAANPQPPVLSDHLKEGPTKVSRELISRTVATLYFLYWRPFPLDHAILTTFPSEWLKILAKDLVCKALILPLVILMTFSKINGIIFIHWTCKFVGLRQFVLTVGLYLSVRNHIIILWMSFSSISGHLIFGSILLSGSDSNPYG